MLIAEGSSLHAASLGSALGSYYSTLPLALEDRSTWISLDRRGWLKTSSTASSRRDYFV